MNRINDASSRSNFYKIREILQKIHKKNSIKSLNR
jgi:hypothetical protein